MTKKKITVLVTGNFNILHPGHIRLFIAAKKICDYLIVGVFSDELIGKAAFIKERHRIEALQNNLLIDNVELISSSIEELILKIKPDIVLKGKEHENNYNIEKDVLALYGGKLLFGSGETVFSSTELLLNELNQQAKLKNNFEKDYRLRHSINSHNLEKLIHNFKNCKVAVIGDLIIDQYITCQALGMSQEDPTICVKPQDISTFIGGAGIVASHASSLGSTVHFLSVAGDDSLKDLAEKELKKNKVKAKIFIDNSRPTTLKKRYRAERKTLLRVNDFKQDSIPISIQNILINEFKRISSDLDLLIFSDFNYGCLPQELVDKIILIAKEKNLMIVADSQSSSQVGNIARFKNINLITPTEREARLSMRNNQAGLIVLLQELYSDAHPENTILKLGADGLLVFSKRDKDFLTDNLSAYNNNPVDVAGAGDSLLVVSSLVIAMGGSIWESALLGSLASAVQVSKVGNFPLKAQEIIDLI